MNSDTTLPSERDDMKKKRIIASQSIGERAFTIFELLIAGAVLVMVLVPLVASISAMTRGAQSNLVYRASYSDTSQVVSGLQRDAASALAVFIPSNDVLGASNADAHEVDFFTRDSNKNPHFRAYTFNTASKLLQVSNYNSPGQASLNDGSATPLKSFTASSISVDSLASDPMVSAIFKGNIPKPIDINYGYPGVIGGNRITQVHLTNTVSDRTIRLLAGTVAMADVSYQDSHFTPPAPVTKVCSYSGLIPVSKTFQWYETQCPIPTAPPVVPPVGPPAVPPVGPPGVPPVGPPVVAPPAVAPPGVPPGTGVTPPVDTGCLNNTVGRPGTSCTTPPPIILLPPKTPCIVDAAGFCTVMVSSTNNVVSIRVLCRANPSAQGLLVPALTGTATKSYNTYNANAYLGSSMLTITFLPAAGGCGTTQSYAWTGVGNPSTVFVDALLPDPNYP